MTPEELAREFEKSPKSLMKAKPNELLFAEDYPEGRMQFVCAAMNEDEDALRAGIQKIQAMPEGDKHLVRALNNLKTIGHKGALCFSKAIFDAMEPVWDAATQQLKFLQILDAVGSDLRTGMGWISEKAAQILDEAKVPGDARIRIWIHWCAAVLRSSPEATPLIEQLAPRRPGHLSKPQINALRDAVRDEAAPWDIRSASIWLLLGNQLVSIETAQSFAEEAYASFPLEALEGVEILTIAIEDDATKLAEYDVIQAKLSQIRKENLFLRDMPASDFIEASERIFQTQEQLPKSALELALQLQECSKRDRMILSALIDDARKADWIWLAHKSNAIKQLGTSFFEHFCTDNPLIIALSENIVELLLENYNANAMMAEEWMQAAADDDKEAMQRNALQWADFCKTL